MDKGVTFSELEIQSITGSCMRVFFPGKKGDDDLSEAMSKKMMWRIDRAYSKVTYDVMRTALNQVEQYQRDFPHCATTQFVIDSHSAVAMRRIHSKVVTQTPSDLIVPSHLGLNSVQQQVVESVFASPFSLVQGPPGTGKTQVSAAILCTLGAHYKKQCKQVMAVAFNNVAVDELAKRTLAMGAKIVRIGNPVLVDPELQAVTMAHLESIQSQNLLVKFKAAQAIHKSKKEALFECENGIRKLGYEISKHAKQLEKLEKKTFPQPQQPAKSTKKKSKGDPTLKATLKQKAEVVAHAKHVKECRAVLDKFRQDRNKLRNQEELLGEQERDAFLAVRGFQEQFKIIQKEIICSVDVVFSTCIGASAEMLDEWCPGAVLVDECAQALEPSCLVPLLKLRPRHGACTHIILVGDHHQLPPTVKCTDSSLNSLRTSLFERLQAFNSPGGGLFKGMLCTQYRMHPVLSRFPSEFFYEGRLENGVQAEQRQTTGLTTFREKMKIPLEVRESPLIFLDIGNATTQTKEKHEGTSYVNEYSANMVITILKALLESGVAESGSSVGVITAYAKQRKKLVKAASAIDPDVEVKTVDGFQGREKEVIVFDMVRSNTTGNLGFLAKDVRRLNVAITRAKRMLIVVGNIETIRTCESDAWQVLIEHIAEVGGICKVP